MTRSIARAIALAFSVGAFSTVLAQSGVLTHNNNNARTGSYFETALNPFNVNVSSLNVFGKLHTWNDIEGQIYTQPLYVHGLLVGERQTRNMVYVATQKNYVYAFDADPPYFAQVWSRFLGAPVPWTEIGTGHKNMFPSIGVTSTPVIDLDGGTIYVVALTKDRGQYFHRVHALDLVSGAEKFNGPVDIEASIPGHGNDSKGGSVTFNAIRQLNRPALLLSNRTLYIGFGSHGDLPMFHGWVFSYSLSLQKLGVYNTTPNGEAGGIWQGGRGLAADQAGNIYFMTGNGSVDFGKRNLGQSVVRLDSALSLEDWFTPGPKSSPTDPNDYRCLNGPDIIGPLGLAHDLDLGSSGPMLVLAPDFSKNRVVGGGKGGMFYLLNANSMGGGDHFHELANIIATHSPEWFGVPCHAIAKDGGTDTHHIHGGPVLWEDRDQGLLIYNWGENDPLKAFRIMGDQLVGPVAKSKMVAAAGMPGGILSVSSAGTPESGLIWATLPLDGDASEQLVRGMLVAFQAAPAPCVGGGCDSNILDLRLLWHSEMKPARDSVGLFAKFAPSTIADGKVFVASFGDPNDPHDATRKGWLHVYGLFQPR